MSAEEAMQEAATAAAEDDVPPKEKLRHHCMARGYTGILFLGRLFRANDTDKTGTLATHEVTNVIKGLQLQFTLEEIGELMQEFDTDGEGTINYEEFLAAVRPEMNADRLAVVEEAFAALDETGDGKVTTDDLKTRYNTAEHPSVLDGSETEEEILNRLIGRFEGNTSEDGVLTKNEFIDYYSGISNSVDNDEYFIGIMKNGYNL